MTAVTRRTVLKRISAGAISAAAIVRSRGASAALPPLPNLPASEALLLRPGDSQFAQYERAFNARTQLTPQLRAMCKNARAVGVMIDWCRSDNIPFAVRCGGHSYEGLSQSASVVIDTRLINSITVDATTKTATVGAGACLGQLYQAIAPRGFAFPGGSCPTVGVSGHLLGGGYGYLARPFGLACDNVLSIDLVDPQGKQVHADAQQNADLFWACRGGGGGTFGVAIGYQLRLIPLTNVLIFNIRSAPLSLARAAAIMKAWQAWAPHAPRTLDSNLVITRHGSGLIDVRCAGQSVGTSQELQRELKFRCAPTCLAAHTSTIRTLTSPITRRRIGAEIYRVSSGSNQPSMRTMSFITCRAFRRLRPVLSFPNFSECSAICRDGFNVSSRRYHRCEPLSKKLTSNFAAPPLGLRCQLKPRDAWGPFLLDAAK